MNRAVRRTTNRRFLRRDAHVDRANHEAFTSGVLDPGTFSFLTAIKIYLGILLIVGH